MNLWAWLGEDEHGSGEIGLKQAHAPAGMEQVEGAYRVAGSRVSLDSIVYCFREGLSPESIAESFPTLTLEQVYGAIAFYLCLNCTAAVF